MHIPDDPLYYEKYYFTPGDLGYKAFDTGVGRVGTLVCWDQWYPEGARLTALQGAQLLFYPTAIGWHPAEKAEFGTSQHDAWRTIQRSHAIANGVYVAVVNRVGHETGDIRGKAAPGDGLEFWGASFFCDPFGRVIAEASHDKEEILVAEVDLSLVEETRRNWPFLRDRRIDSYNQITSRMIDWSRVGALGTNHVGTGLRPVQSEQARQAFGVANGTSCPHTLNLPKPTPACPPSGSLTLPPGWHGHTIATTGPASSSRFHGSTPKSFAIWDVTNAST
jgi:hypothetical protein